jgi:hypothetical protein
MLAYCFFLGPGCSASSRGRLPRLRADIITVLSRGAKWSGLQLHLRRGKTFCALYIQFKPYGNLSVETGFSRTRRLNEISAIKNRFSRGRMPSERRRVVPVQCSSQPRNAVRTSMLHAAAVANGENILCLMYTVQAAFGNLSVETQYGTSERD